jgi:hypothetical protein
MAKPGQVRFTEGTQDMHIESGRKIWKSLNRKVDRDAMCSERSVRYALKDEL